MKRVQDDTYNFWRILAERAGEVGRQRGSSTPSFAVFEGRPGEGLFGCPGCCVGYKAEVAKLLRCKRNTAYARQSLIGCTRIVSCANTNCRRRVAALLAVLDEPKWTSNAIQTRIQCAKNPKWKYRRLKSERGLPVAVLPGTRARRVAERSEFTRRSLSVFRAGGSRASVAVPQREFLDV